MGEAASTRGISTTRGTDLLKGPHGVTRCWWCGTDPLYVNYHDLEWGRRQTHDHRLFEKICLEGFQAGLSWLTILRKRDRFRAVFHDFDPDRVARMGRRDVERLLGDAGIIRHRGKIESTINNAHRCLELLEEFGSLFRYLEEFRPPSRKSPPVSRHDVPARTDQSIRLSKDLRKRGWSFVGPTTMYAFMQAVGIVNDHLAGCHVRQVCHAAHAATTAR